MNQDPGPSGHRHGRRTWPAWALAVVALTAGAGAVFVAIPQLAVLALIMASNRWALLASYLAGLALVAWIRIQLLVLQRYFFLQPVIAAWAPWKFCWHWPGTTKP